MQVTLMVERNVIPGEQESVKRLLRELRSNATRQPGFISGQSVIDAFSPTRVMTITMWTSMAAWEAWENSPERVSITGRIAGLLQEPPVLRLWGQEEQIDWRQHSTPAVAAGAFAW